MNNRNTILNTIQDELKKYITVANGFSCTPHTVRRGVYAFNDLQKRLPSVCFTFTQEVPFEDETYPMTYDDTDIKAMSIMFYGYAKANDASDSDKIYDMVNDLEVFLQSTDFSYNEDLKINSIEIKEAGPSDKVLSFIIDVSIFVNDDLE